MKVEFWFDVVCPFAYFASTRIDALAAEAGVDLAWRPILLGGLFREHGGADDPNVVMPEGKWAWTRRDAALQAEALGLPIAFPPGHPRRSLNAMRLLTAASADRVPALAAALYRAYWVDGVDVSDLALLAPIARSFGIDPARMEDPEIKARLRAATAEAAARGVFGVPTVTIGTERYWGADRLSFVRERLGLPPIEPPVTPKPGGSLVFFHDLSSPFSYLASTGIETLARQAGAALDVRPILVGALFKAIGTPLVPMATFPEAKARYVGEDLQRWAARRGVPFRFASEFPIRSVLANRVTLVEPATLPVLYRAAWAEDRPISTPDQVRAVLDGSGFDGEALVVRADGPEVKEALRANTEDAAQRGVCGVPSFVVRRAAGNEEVLIWGQDRMDVVERWLAA